jgi:hypothetical protein
MAFRGPVEERFDDYISAKVAARRFAEFVNVMIDAHTKG